MPGKDASAFYYVSEQPPTALFVASSYLSVSSCRFESNLQGLYWSADPSRLQEGSSIISGEITDVSFSSTSGMSGMMVVAANRSTKRINDAPITTNLVLQNTNFTDLNNSLYQFGGAIGFYLSSSTAKQYNITIKDSHFTRCESAGVAGALAFDLGSSTKSHISLNISNTIFTSNKAAVGAAMFFNYSSATQSSINITTDSTVFTSNIADRDSVGEAFGTWWGCGGAIHLDSSSCNNLQHGGSEKQQPSTIEGAYKNGCADTAASECQIHMEMVNTTFYNNSASAAGGAVAVDMSQGRRTRVRITARDTLLQSNTATVGGGFVLLGRGSRGGWTNMSLTNTSFTQNYAETGGAVYVDMVDSTSHTYFQDQGSTSHTTFQDQGSTTADSPVIPAITFHNNTARSGAGGAMALIHSPVAAKGNSSIRIKDCRFELNSADNGGGGAIYHYGKIGSDGMELNAEGEPLKLARVLVLQNCSFSKNRALNGGALFLRNSTGTMTGVTFTENSAALLGGALYSRAEFTLTQCSFQSNQAVQGGAVYGTIGDAQEVNNLKMKSCAFTANSAATDGGAMFLAGGRTDLSGCEVHGNYATSRGGAIFFSNICTSSAASNESTCAVVAGDGTQVFSNEALAGGGMFVAYPVSMTKQAASKAVNGPVDLQLSDAVHNNTAEYGANVLVAPAASALQVLGSSTDDATENTPAPRVAYPSTTGVRGKIPLKVQVGQQAGVRVLVELWSSRSDVYLTGFIKGTDAYGIADFTDLHIIGGTPDAGVNSTMVDVRDKQYVLKVSSPDFQHVQYKNVTVTVRGCMLGEAKVQSLLSASASTCDMCLEGSYAVITRSQKGCTACPNGNTANCSEGIITPSLGHWQGAAGSDVIQTCPNLGACQGKRREVFSHFATCLSPTNTTCTWACQQYIACTSSCPVGDATCWDSCTRYGSCTAPCADGNGSCKPRDYSNQLCSGGYQGYLCGSCKPGYGAYKVFRCGECMTKIWVWLLYVFAIVVVCVIVMGISFSVVNSLADNDDDLRMPDVFKVLTMHVQMLIVVSSLLVDWPPMLKGFFQSVQYFMGPSQSGILSLDCLGVGTGNGATLWVALAFPAIVVTLALPLWALIQHVLHKTPYDLAPHMARSISPGSHIITSVFVMKVWHRIKFKHLAFASALVAVFLLYTPLVETAFAPFTCVRVMYTGQYHWALDMNTQCWTRDHLNVALGPALVGVFVFCFAVPMALLWGGPRGMDKPRLTSSIMYAFMYRQYREGLWFWEPYSCVHVCAMVAVSMFARVYGPYHQLLLFMLLLMTNSTLAHTFRPFRKRVVHNLHVTSISLMLLTCTAILAIRDGDRLYTQATGTIDTSVKFTTFQNAVSILATVLNITFILWALLVLIAAQSHHARNSAPKDSIQPSKQRTWFGHALLNIEWVVAKVMVCHSLSQGNDQTLDGIKYVFNSATDAELVVPAAPQSDKPTFTAPVPPTMESGHNMPAAPPDRGGWPGTPPAAVQDPHLLHRTGSALCDGVGRSEIPAPAGQEPHPVHRTTSSALRDEMGWSETPAAAGQEPRSLHRRPSAVRDGVGWSEMLPAPAGQEPRSMHRPASALHDGVMWSGGPTPAGQGSHPTHRIASALHEGVGWSEMLPAPASQEPRSMHRTPSPLHDGTTRSGTPPPAGQDPRPMHRSPSTLRDGVAQSGTPPPAGQNPRPMHRSPSTLRDGVARCETPPPAGQDPRLIHRTASTLHEGVGWPSEAGHPATQERERERFTLESALAQEPPAMHGAASTHAASFASRPFSDTPMPAHTSSPSHTAVAAAAAAAADQPLVGSAVGSQRDDTQEQESRHQQDSKLVDMNELQGMYLDL